ncbi:MAG: hypothetical protein NTW29_04105 [Bacteroidetes bacterium]|nr:hypothetical protein [Bacteroidota bacterium]
MRPVFIAMLMTIAFGISSYAQEKVLPAELKPFVLPKHEMLDFIKADLNMDGRADYLLILKQEGEDTLTFDNEKWDAARTLLLITRQADNKLKLAVTNTDIVLCRHCGGAMGDPYMGIEAKAGEFTLDFYGGSSWKWGNTITFRYDKLKKNWFLQREIITSSHPEEDRYVESTTTIGRGEIGNISLEKYTPYYNSDSSLMRVNVAKTYFYESPDLKSKPRKGYLLKDDIVTTVKVFKNFVECTFNNLKGSITTGYILRKDLEAVRHW